MNCDCISKIDARLKDAGHNYQLAPRLVFGEKMQLDALLVVETAWIDPPKHSKKKSPSIICTYCPFCRKKTAKANGKAR